LALSRRDLIVAASVAAATLPAQGSMAAIPASRPRARALGIAPGLFKPGALNAITDVEGVRVGQVTLNEGANVRTGVTAIAAHGGALFQDKVSAGFAQGNGFGKFAGSTQVIELGELETPIILTNNLSVAEGMAGAVEWTLAQPGNEQVRSVNAVVGETNDGFLDDIRGRHVTIQHVKQAIANLAPGPVAEGCVGAGAGTQCFHWKGGIGTSSRLLPKALGGYTLGVLVQTNFGGVLQVAGAPVGRELHMYEYKDFVEEHKADGSCIMIVATDAPLSDRNLTRLARRALYGMGRTGSSFSNGSGDYVLAFSTAPSVRRTAERRKGAATYEDLANDAASPLFQAVIETTEEAIYNALLAAVTTTGVDGHKTEAIDPMALKKIIDSHGLART
jgi:D-aminopeptidase